MRNSWYESTARLRLDRLLDPASFVEFLPPSERCISPHLQQLNLASAFDDGVIVGRGELFGRRVLVAAQEGAFLGGAVGEVHGAKLVGLLERARDERPAAVLLLVESGGVRLHEANAGLIAISEIMRAQLALRRAGVAVVVINGGRFGCFGGMGIVARLADAIVMNEEGRLGLSGPEVIETSRGVEAFDASDRALVWRTFGGKHRTVLGEVTTLVDDDIDAFRQAAHSLIDTQPEMTLQSLLARHAQLGERLARFGNCEDAREIWRQSGIEAPERVPEMPLDEFLDALQRTVR